MIGKLVATAFMGAGVAVLSMMLVPPAENARAQIVVWLLWFMLGLAVALMWSDR